MLKKMFEKKKLGKIYLENLMYVPCIIRRSINNQHYAQNFTTALFIYAGSYMFRQ
jgi:hypothetical protein